MKVKTLRQLSLLLLSLAVFACGSKESNDPQPSTPSGVKLVITMPASTTGDVFLVGSIGGVHDGPDSWKPERKLAAYKLTRQADGKYTLTIPNDAIKAPVGLEYKFVAGDSWEQVEVTADCKDEVPNRSIAVGTKDTEITETVANWKHLAPCR
jgi:hypothetical protein